MGKPQKVRRHLLPKGKRQKGKNKKDNKYKGKDKIGN